MDHWPDFVTFISSLNENTIQNIAEDAKKKCEEVKAFGVGSQTLAISWTVSLELLALYHQWLLEELSQAPSD